MSTYSQEFKPLLPEVDNGYDFSDVHDNYRDFRDLLHAEEIANGSNSSEFLAKTVEAKEKLAIASLSLYARSVSVDSFRHEFENIINNHAGAEEDALRMGTNDPVLGAYLLPLSLEQEGMPSAIESVQATIDNLEISGEFADIAEEWADGMLLTGANAWGSFYAVKGGIPRQLQKVGFEQLPYGEISDLDLLVVTSGATQIKHILESYINSGYFSAVESERFEAFQVMRDQNRAEMFSARTQYKGVEQSIHFLTQDVLDDVIDSGTMTFLGNDEFTRLNIIRDFRPNVPRNVIKNGGYNLHALRSGRSIKFSPALEQIKTPSGRGIGYISESPADGRLLADGEEEYLMGLLGFFLAVDPVVILDKNTQLSSAINVYQGRIADLMHGDQPKSIPRQERMPGHALSRITKSLSYSHE